VLESGFESSFDASETSNQNPTLSRRTFLLALTSLLALAPLGQEAVAQTDFEPFTFAFINDVHLANGMTDSTYLLQESQLFLQDVVKQLNGRHLDFVIFGGDQVEGPGKDDSFWNLFIDVLQILNAPWFFVLGESDVSGRKAVDKMDTYGPDLKGRNLTNGKPYWSCDPVPNVHLIGLDTSKPNTTTGDLSNEQLAWLKNDLAANKGKFTLVVSHHPLLAPPPYDGGPPWDDFMVVQGASAREAFATSRDVRLCVSGHVPVNKVQQEGGIWYVAAPPLAMYPCQFKIFTVSPQAVHMETFQVSYEALVKKAKKIMENSRIAYQYSSSKPQSFIRIAEGEDLDRNAMLPLVSGAVQRTEKKKREKPAKEEKVKRGKEKKESPKNESESETKPDSAKDSGSSDAGKDDLKKSDPGKETVKESVKETVKESTKEPVKDAAKESIKEPTKEPVKEPAKDAPKPLNTAPQAPSTAPKPKPIPVPAPSINSPSPVPSPVPSPSPSPIPAPAPAPVIPSK